MLIYIQIKISCSELGVIVYYYKIIMLKDGH